MVEATRGLLLDDAREDWVMKKWLADVKPVRDLQNEKPVWLSTPLFITLKPTGRVQ